MLFAPVLVACSAMCFVAFGTIEKRSPAGLSAGRLEGADAAAADTCAGAKSNGAIRMIMPMRLRDHRDPHLAAVITTPSVRQRGSLCDTGG